MVILCRRIKFVELAQTKFVWKQNRLIAASIGPSESWTNIRPNLARQPNLSSSVISSQWLLVTTSHQLISRNSWLKGRLGHSNCLKQLVNYQGSPCFLSFKFGGLRQFECLDRCAGLNVWISTWNFQMCQALQRLFINSSASEFLEVLKAQV